MKQSLILTMAALILQAGNAFAECSSKYPLVLKVSRSEQTMFVYERGQMPRAYLVSTGKSGHETPDFSGHFKRTEIYWDSSIYPQGDYMGLGNMPYAMFFKGGYAVHGTPTGNFNRLGNPASHGCVRMYPEQALELNTLVNKYGLRNVCLDIGEFPIERGDEASDLRKSSSQAEKALKSGQPGLF